MDSGFILKEYQEGTTKMNYIKQTVIDLLKALILYLSDDGEEDPESKKYVIKK